ncbi:MAG: hypothetical protein KatS3mg089_0189 [Patescibacteria group bacterium]|nr:MAG: hypothetical protein KatS3mg089_0189 [Patescibacteria group bacterium]
MRKALFILIPSLILATSIFFLIQIFLIRSNDKGALQVTASPKSKVYLNGEFIGETPLCRCEQDNMLKVGKYNIKLVPTTSGFSEFQEKIIVSKSVLTVVDHKFGKGATSEGSIITLQPLKESNTRSLLVLSIPDKSEVLLDNTSVGFTPVLIKDITESDHELIIRKSGYAEKKVKIRTPTGYQLLAKVYLGVDEEEIVLSPTPSPTSASPSATPTPPIRKVTILQTPVGFLRVRAESNIESSEIGRVTPGQEFELLDEVRGWYKIKLSDGKEGWISNQYAKKIE